MMSDVKTTAEKARKEYPPSEGSDDDENPFNKPELLDNDAKEENELPKI